MESKLEVERGLIRFNSEMWGSFMGWKSINDQHPRDIEDEFLVWGDGWQFPRLASYDPETEEFFDPESCSTYDDVTYWWAAVPAAPESTGL